MSTLNPVLSSASLSAQTQVSPTVAQENLKMNDQTKASSSAAGNSTVTLSEQALKLSQESQNLAATQTVRESESTENEGMESRQTDAGLTYADSLNNSSNRSMSNEEAMEPASDRS
jgi:hypothetical protein